MVAQPAVIEGMTARAIKLRQSEAKMTWCVSSLCSTMQQYNARYAQAVLLLRNWKHQKRRKKGRTEQNHVDFSGFLSLFTSNGSSIKDSQAGSFFLQGQSQIVWKIEVIKPFLVMPKLTNCTQAFLMKIAFYEHSTPCGLGLLMLLFFHAIL